MALTFKGPIVAATNELTGASTGSFAIVLTTGYSTGDVVVVWVANKATGTTGDRAEISVVDSVGNSYIRAAEFAAGGAVGAAAAVFYANVTQAITSGVPVTVQIPTSGLRQFIDAAVGGFTGVATGNTVSHVAATGNTSATGTTVISGGVAGLAPADYLFLATVANRTSTVPPNVTGDATEGWALTGAVSTTGTTGGTTASGLYVNWNYKIATGASGVTRNASGLIAGGARAIVVVALKEQAGVVAHDGAATFAGAGNVSAQIDKFISATFDGAGSLNTLANLGEEAAATFSGSGVLSIAMLQRMVGSAVFAGAGDLSANASQATAHVGQATFNGTGSLSAFGNLNARIAATFGGAGTFSVNAEKSKTAAVTFNGSGSVSIYGSLNARIAATFGGAGSLSVEGVVPSGAVGFRSAIGIWLRSGGVSAGGVAHVGEARFNGAGNLSVAARLNQQAAATFAGAGQLTVAANLNEQASAVFNGTGSLSAQTQKSKTGEATFNGAGSLSAAVRARFLAFATFNGTGNVSVNTIQRHVQGAIFNGAGSMSAFSQAENVKDGAATFQGAGSLSANVTRHNQAGLARFEGAGSLSVTARLGQRALAQLAGAGSLSVSLRQNNRAFATFQGAGSLSVLGVQRIQIAARFAGAGDFSVLVTQGNAARAIFAGAGSLSALANQFAFNEQVGEATLNGQGGMIVDMLQFGPRRTRTSTATATLNVRSNNATDGRRNTANDVRGSPPKVRRTG